MAEGQRGSTERPTTWLGHYVARVRSLYQGASVPGSDPLAERFTRDGVTTDEYRAALDGAGRSPAAKALLDWVVTETLRGNREPAILALRVSHRLVDRELGERQRRTFTRDASDYAQMMQLFGAHLLLTYVLNEVLPGREHRMARLPEIEAIAKTRADLELREHLRVERRGFAESLARHLEAFLDHRASDEEEAAYHARLVRRATREVGAEFVDTYAAGWEGAILGIVARGEVAIFRALLQLPALMEYAGQAGLNAVRDEPAITLAPATDDEGDEDDPWERFAAPQRDSDENSDRAARLWSAVHATLPTLSPRAREDFEAFLAGERAVDIAARTGRTPQAVSNNLTKAARAAREMANRQD